MNFDLNNFSWGQMTAEIINPFSGLMAAIIGGGGKSGLMVHWARELWARGEPVLMASTSAAFKTCWPKEQTVPARSEAEALAAAERALAGEQLLLVGPERQAEEGKWGGVFPAWLDNLNHACPRLSILVEADSARGRNFKFHAAHEPVLPSRTRLITAVVGLGLIGCQAGPNVHQLALAPEAVEAGQLINSSCLAGWLTARSGYVARFLTYGPGLLFFNKAEHSESRQAAEYIADRVHKLYPQMSIVAGSLWRKAFYRLYGPPDYGR